MGRSDIRGLHTQLQQSHGDVSVDEFTLECKPAIATETHMHDDKLPLGDVDATWAASIMQCMKDNVDMGVHPPGVARTLAAQHAAASQQPPAAVMVAELGSESASMEPSSPQQPARFGDFLAVLKQQPIFQISNLQLEDEQAKAEEEKAKPTTEQRVDKLEQCCDEIATWAVKAMHKLHWQIEELTDEYDARLGVQAGITQEMHIKMSRH